MNNDVSEIVLDDDSFTNMKELKSQLEVLYLGNPQVIFLKFPQNYRKDVELIFDGIIKRHGLRQVLFNYCVSGAEHD